MDNLPKCELCKKYSYEKNYMIHCSICKKNICEECFYKFNKIFKYCIKCIMKYNSNCFIINRKYDIIDINKLKKTCYSNKKLKYIFEDTVIFIPYNLYNNIYCFWCARQNEQYVDVNICCQKKKICSHLVHKKPIIKYIDNIDDKEDIEYTQDDEKNNYCIQCNIKFCSKFCLKKGVYDKLKLCYKCDKDCLNYFKLKINICKKCLKKKEETMQQMKTKFYNENNNGQIIKCIDCNKEILSINCVKCYKNNFEKIKYYCNDCKVYRCDKCIQKIKHNHSICFFKNIDDNNCCECITETINYPMKLLCNLCNEGGCVFKMKPANSYKKFSICQNHKKTFNLNNKFFNTNSERIMFQSNLFNKRIRTQINKSVSITGNLKHSINKNYDQLHICSFTNQIGCKISVKKCCYCNKLYLKNLTYKKNKWRHCFLCGPIYKHIDDIPYEKVRKLYEKTFYYKKLIYFILFKKSGVYLSRDIFDNIIYSIRFKPYNIKRIYKF